MLVPTLTELRKAKGLTQRELAERLGVSTNTVTRWEMDTDAGGAIRPRGPARRLLGIILEWDPDDIKYGSDRPAPPPADATGDEGR